MNLGGLGKILGSFKGVAFLIVMIAITVLVVLGKASIEQFTELVQWTFGSVVFARAGEEGMKGMGANKAKMLEQIKTLLGMAPATAVLNVSAPEVEAANPDATKQD